MALLRFIMPSPIYVLHGWANENNESKWQPLIKALEGFGLKAIFVNFPGLDYELSGPWSLSSYVGWLKHRLDGQRVILLGHSFGGQISCRFAAIYPENVEKLILIDSAGIKDQRLVVRIKRQIFLIIAKAGKLVTKNESLKRLLYRLVGANDYLQASEVMKKTMQQVLNDEVKADLPNIKAKSLILWGEKDSITPLFLAQVFHSGIKGSSLTVIKSARHSPQFSHVNEVARLINKFIYE